MGEGRRSSSRTRGVGALDDGEGLSTLAEAFAEGFDDGGAEVVLGGSLGEELEDGEVVVSVDDDAGERVGFAEDEAEGVGLGGELGAEGEGGAAIRPRTVARYASRLRAGFGGDHAEGDLGGVAIEGGAEGNGAAVDDGDEGSAGKGLGASSARV